MIKSGTAAIAICLFGLASFAKEQSEPSLVPLPQAMELREGAFELRPSNRFLGFSGDSGTKIVVDASSQATGEYLAERLRKSTGYQFPIVEINKSKAVKQAILLTTQDSKPSLGEEGYEATVSPNSVVISARTPSGVFYGVQTLLQLMPPEVFASRPVKGVLWKIPGLHIEDRPRFRWRGLMLDVSRHFYTKTQVERLLDMMAMYKLNTLHWHLVDSEGWRIEIKKYPKLTQEGAWRKNVWRDDLWRKDIGYGDDPNATYGPDGRYGGYYTQDDIREVVAYAQVRHIDVIPEIEMPGHSAMALTVYPELSCSLSNAYKSGVYCAGKESTFTFLQDVLTEVFDLFPSQYIHIGGDEVVKDNWIKCPDCQSRRLKEGLKDAEALQGYFVRRIEKFVTDHGRTIIGWSEIRQGGIGQNAVLMDWIGGAVEAATEGHDVVMSPLAYSYFDHYQSLDSSSEPIAIGDYLPTWRIYDFDPMPAKLNAKFEARILGGQANIWTEFIATQKHLDYMLFPRLCALAETLWSSKKSHNWNDFTRRMEIDYKRLDQLGVNYRRENSSKVGEWATLQTSAHEAELDWDVTSNISAVGDFHVILDYRRGAGLKIDWIALSEDGKEIARDTHSGFAGPNPRKPVYILNLPTRRQGARYSVQVHANPDGSNESFGTVYCQLHTLLPAVRESNKYIDAKISLNRPGFEALSIDSLGKEHFPLLKVNESPAKPWCPVQATRHGSRVEYRRSGASVSAVPRWTIEVGQEDIRLESNWTSDDPPEPLVLDVDQHACHITLLGHVGVAGSIQLPAIMHLPDRGSFQISVLPKAAEPLGYDAFIGSHSFVRVTLPGATWERSKVSYCWKVAAIHPEIKGMAADTRFDGFRRDWLNIFQINPRRGLLANNAASDNCAFCYYEYADLARRTPPLADGLKALDMIRETLDAIFHGTSAYGMPGHGDFPEFSSDTYPSLLIAAHDYVEGSKDFSWLAKNYNSLAAWADQMLATDHNGDGLIEYAVSGNSGSWPAVLINRPANWWDTIGFGHDDAYANALAYRALGDMEELARQSNHAKEELRYRKAADRLHAAYFDAFYNPATGVLAGWRSSDGQLHDYYFPWVNGIAIHYGLVPRDKANAIMDRLLNKMKEVDYTRFDLGLPSNLIPVAKKDYVTDLHRWGGSKKNDGSDGFQIYENGGATSCFSYFTLAALYDLGRIQDADKIFFPMLGSFARGDFQGFCESGLSKDWKSWEGVCWGYEGFLVDNYYTLLATLDREAAVKRARTRY